MIDFQNKLINIDKEFVQKVENNYFRTFDDVGATPNAMLIWNQVRKHIGLKPININDLPAYCLTHEKYHVIHLDYL